MLDHTFPADYSFSAPADLPSAGDVTRFSPTSSSYCRDGLLVQFRTASSNWIGLFEFGDERMNGTTGVYTCPNACEAFIVARGRGYLLNVPSRTLSVAVIEGPITICFPIAELGILLLVDFTRISALDLSGIRWKTARISDGEIKTVRIENHLAVGEAWDASVQSFVPFSIDIRDGKLSGGMQHS